MIRKWIVYVLFATLLIQTGLAGHNYEIAYADTVGPQILVKTPTNAATNVPVNANLVLTFDQSVKKGPDASKIGIYEMDSTVFTEYTVSSSKITINPSNPTIVTIALPDNKSFELGKSYYVNIAEGAFVSVSMNANYAGINNTAGWNFTTTSNAADTQAPQLSVATPLAPIHNATNVAVNTQIAIQFNEPIYTNSGFITLHNSDNSSDTRMIPVTSSSVGGSGTNTIRISLPANLRTNKTYQIEVPNTAFVDAVGNAFAGISRGSWSFATTPPPLGTPVLSPADGAFAVNIRAALTMTFPKRLARNTGQISLYRIADNGLLQHFDVSSSGAVQMSINSSTNETTVTVQPSSPLGANIGYYVLVDAGAFRDSSNASSLYEGMLDAGEWNFTTGYGDDVTAPVLTTKVPSNTATTTSSTLELTFDEPVFQGNGNIVIKSAPNGTTIASIPVTDAKVSGGGTTKITVSPGVTLVDGTTYYVQIGSQAFRDASGNNFAGMLSTDTTTWRFTVSNDKVKPTIVTLSPANGVATVPTTGGSFSIMFSEPIRVLNASGISFKRTSTTSSSSAVMAIDPDNNRKLNITPDPLLANTNYYVEIAANAISDLAGNTFDGILNTYQWAFKTSSATGAPTVASVEMSGSSRIALTYNQMLDSTSLPSAGTFYVTVNGTYRAITAVQITDAIVYLTLQSPVVNGQEIRLYYTAPVDLNAAAIRSLSTLTKAASISNQLVTNTPDTTVPRPISGTVAGNLITMTFSEELSTVSSSAYTQFYAYVNGSYRTFSSVGGTGSTMTLYLSGSEVSVGQTVTLSYSKGAYPLTDVSGNPVASFSAFQILNGVDTAIPQLQTLTVSGNKLSLTYNEALSTTSKPATGAYAVLVDGTARTVSTVTVSGYQVDLTLSSAVASGQTIRVSYTRQTPYLTDLAGNPAESFSNLGISGAGSTLTVIGAIAKGSTITLNFSDNLNSGFIPLISQFSVKSGNSVRSIANVQVNGSTVVLTLVTPVSIGDAIKVSYSTSGGTMLRSSGGVNAESFTDLTAANQTTWSDDPTSDFESVTGGGIGLKKQVASTTPTTTPGGKSVNRYSLPESKVKSAFDTITGIGGEPRLSFTVPSTEAGASVAFPLSPLKTARDKFPKAKVVVNYKNASYEMPLDQLTMDGSATSLSGSLLVNIDMGSNSLTDPLTTAISAAGSKLIGEPVNMETFIVNNNGAATKISSFGGYVKRSITVDQTLETRQTAVVWYDPEVGKISYAPTHVETANGKSVVTFQRKGNSAYAVIKGNVVYNDLGAHWARNDILLMANKYIIDGRTPTTFEPKKAITRAEFATFISKGLGLSGDKTAAAKFQDLNSGHAAMAYIGAAAKAGIIQGMTDGSFKPNSPVTREQMASMMVRAAEYVGNKVDLSQNAATMLKRFKDNAKIGTWAQVDVAKAVQMGVINGMSNGNFGAKSNATRAEAAVMIERLLNLNGLMDT
ncbi:Ig-like domain-containing protein [Paenibacillus methanolicus]|uniref:Putative repeat protein (TIGR02059 family) n=1 Tax=Paenibacillus methanolicus TaxID=582686 RepID=A0A5S5CAQ8_9BACL|nr:Ig-like domain-containing protein [Paenibacillus methanolicus]TYP75708.1 putative repeat protein (TIGR02059 family) [Paenibacillus methanolicus]